MHKELLPDDWRTALQSELEQPRFARLQRFVARERKRHQVFPGENDVFRAFRLTPLATTRVVVLGQDPYHDDGQAHGLCFSVPRETPIPRSLRNIHRELEDDLGHTPPSHGNLETWAQQGVLLLNTVLTVRAHAANSHRGKGWEVFTEAVIRRIDASVRPVVFILWGRQAQQTASFVDPNRHTLITSAHPSPLSARRGFFGSKPFSRTDQALAANGSGPIDWQL
ncbi:MAG: uracil-DNA glycosylase [Lentisphaerae bacterium]|jgi:uracil-DNA glycosylase|nr:uracil-DNA glycosylase [Lentisphaerota bacterium]MBT4822030.1 uracil-DNA glycosylase [Lentisphaerota bacterium]MBT5609898.1 uracil-DNA glycosylase [Lentisphaerota bacterium]MBT7061423.1 uracil-DNA glycosylase [Lentisphaerota bacterium]MBT7847501.1 uracil-DNA glycosylase [Lentisphaerota bacterium]